MTKANAKQYVIAAMLITALMVILYRLSGGKDRDTSVRMGLGVAVASVVLAFVAEFAPRVAVGLSILTATSTTLALGGEAFKGLSNSFDTAAAGTASAPGKNPAAAQKVDPKRPIQSNPNLTGGWKN
jgi:hypothetical protein